METNRKKQESVWVIIFFFFLFGDDLASSVSLATLPVFCRIIFSYIVNDSQERRRPHIKRPACLGFNGDYSWGRKFFSKL
jgi:hypothetical protein